MALTYALLGGILAVSLFIAWKVLRRPESAADTFHRELLESLRRDVQEGREKDRVHLQERIDALTKLLNSGISENSRAIQSQFRQYSEIIGQVTKELTKLGKTNEQVMGFSEQLKDLQSILQDPKGKGVLGEYWLETMLSHVLPPEQYQKQYKFKNGEIVDAVVFFQEKLIPIDAKFSTKNYTEIGKQADAKKRDQLENDFKKQLKLRIDETAKYIRPEESTTDYAFMFIPAEGIYYDLLVQKVGTMDINRMNLIQYAHSKRVLIVSPNTFFAFLQTVIEGLRAFKMQESVQEILKRVEQLGKHLGSYEEYMKKMGNHLGTTVSMYNQAYDEFRKVDKDIFRITEGGSGGNAQALSVEKPTAHVEEKIEAITAANVKKQR